jgi:hypothetical protein
MLQHMSEFPSCFRLNSHNVVYLSTDAHLVCFHLSTVASDTANIFLYVQIPLQALLSTLLEMFPEVEFYLIFRWNWSLNSRIESFDS